MSHNHHWKNKRFIWVHTVFFYLYLFYKKYFIFIENNFYENKYSTCPLSPLRISGDKPLGVMRYCGYIILVTAH